MEVRTKPYGEKHLYHFSIHSAQTERAKINISIEEDSSFTHGTEVMVDLNGSLSKMGANQLINALKLDLWYRLPDVPIELYINGVRREIRCLQRKRTQLDKSKDAAGGYGGELSL